MTEIVTSPDEILMPEGEYLSLINVLAAAYARRYPLVSVEDVRQELWCKWLEKNQYIVSYITDEDRERGERKLRRAVDNWAADYCLAETAHINGYKAEDVYFYSRPQLRAMLSMLSEPTVWTALAVGPEQEGRVHPRPAAERGDEMAVLADLHRVCKRLRDDDREVLKIRFVDTGVGDPKTGEEEQAVFLAYEEICDLYGCSPATARSRVSRAVGRMQKLLGGTKSVPIASLQHKPNGCAGQRMAARDWNGAAA